MELVVLVDEQNRPIGTAPKATVHGAATPLHRGVSVFLFDGAGRLLLQQRALGKRTWPGVWSNTCCGHPAPGESVEDAARRRLRDELGLEAADLRVSLPDYRYRAERDGVVENEICPVLTGRVLGTPDPRRAEVEALRWVDWGEFIAECERFPERYSPWCVEETRLLAAKGL
jgi:isopentenyl-diphosphate delta-isomerase type 1